MIGSNAVQKSGVMQIPGEIGYSPRHDLGSFKVHPPFPTQMQGINWTLRSSRKKATTTEEGGDRYNKFVGKVSHFPLVFLPRESPYSIRLQQCVSVILDNNPTSSFSQVESEELRWLHSSKVQLFKFPLTQLISVSRARVPSILRLLLVVNPSFGVFLLPPPPPYGELRRWFAYTRTTNRETRKKGLSLVLQPSLSPLTPKLFCS